VKRPLVVMTVYNRPNETMAALQSLEETTDLSEITLAVMDNGSDADLPEAISDWAMRCAARVKDSCIKVYRLPQNIGCPRALNLALKLNRQPGQPVVKIDNDVRMLTTGWVESVRGLIAGREAAGRQVAMVGAWYDGVWEGRLLGEETGPAGQTLYHVCPVIGHAVWHTGAFMDTVSYFDVLADDHLYGFEDLILSHKASVLGWETLVWKGWQIENLQRHSSLGEGRSEHVERMRPLYEERLAVLAAGGMLVTGPDGKPVENSGKEMMQ
jgi:glycosyltransferase involved in cell wall biosynthesis